MFTLIMQKYKGRIHKTLQFWLIASILCGAAVYPLTLLMPLNKHIYSSSFLFLVISICGSSITFFVLLIDILPKQVPILEKPIKIISSPLKWLGMNPLAVFVGMDLLAILMIIYIKVDGVSVWGHFYHYCFESWISSPPVGATVFACFFLLLWTTVAGLMYRFKLFIKL